MKKILICDDEEGIRESLKLILEEHYELILTDSGAQAKEVLDNADDIGLVLMDIKMPKASGMETLKQIKEKHPGLKIIMVTGYKSVETAAEATAAGAAGYVLKPFKSDEILATVKKQLV